MTVSGRNLPADVVVIAALNALATIVLIVSLWGGFSEIPNLIGNLFSPYGYIFGFSYLVLILLVVFGFICLAPLAVAYFLLRGDPVGRELEAFMLAVLVLAAFGQDQIAGTYWFAMIATGACVAVLYVSPWANHLLRESARARNTPGPVVLARCLSFALFATLALDVVLSVPGVRFLGELGASFVFAVLADGAGAALGWVGYVALTRGPDTTGRVKVTAGCGLALLSQLIVKFADSQPFTSTLPMLLLTATIVAALWLPQTVRDWFAGVASTSPLNRTSNTPVVPPPAAY